MTAVEESRSREIEESKTAEGWRWGGRFWLLVAVGLLVSHGCHGADEDHEPTVGPPVSAEQ